MDSGEELIRWTVRLAMICYASTLALGPWCRQPRLRLAAQLFWSAGCLLFCGHLISAFHFYHHWSHSHAFADTAQKTAESIGWKFGWGIYVNHLFAVVWTTDVLWGWIAPLSYERRPWMVSASIHAFLLFIAANGLVVFKDGPIRWVSLAVCAVLIFYRVFLVMRSRSHGTVCPAKLVGDE